MEKMNAFVSAHPQVFGILWTAIGTAGLVAAVQDWDWLFKKDVSPNTYTLKKIDGWINFFGRRTARIVVGIGSVFVILFGVLWFLIYAFYYKR